MDPYKSIFWKEFSRAEIRGLEAVQNLWNKVFQENKDNVTKMAELTLVLNWKSWNHYDDGQDELGDLYDTLWSDNHNFAMSHFTGGDLDYYYNTTD